MRTFELLKDVAFNERNAHVESLHSNEEGRALRFAFLPGQQIDEHDSPSSPIHLVILQGKGMFAGADGVERVCSEGMMVAFDAGESHQVRALDEKLVYLAVYSENPATHLVESEHRKMVESRPEHHAHEDDPADTA